MSPWAVKAETAAAAAAAPSMMSSVSDLGSLKRAKQLRFAFEQRCFLKHFFFSVLIFVFGEKLKKIKIERVLF